MGMKNPCKEEYEEATLPLPLPLPNPITIPTFHSLILFSKTPIFSFP